MASWKISRLLFLCYLFISLWTVQGFISVRQGLPRSRTVHHFSTLSTKPFDYSLHLGRTQPDSDDGRQTTRMFLVDGARYYLDGFGIGVLFTAVSAMWRKERWNAVMRVSWQRGKLLGDVSGIFYLCRSLLTMLQSNHCGQRRQRQQVLSNCVAASISGAYFGLVTGRSILRQVVSFAVGRFLLDQYLDPWSKRALAQDDEPYEDLLKLAAQKGVAVVNDQGEPLHPDEIFKLLVAKEKIREEEE
jgi:hypothetical protein